MDDSRRSRICRVRLARVSCVAPWSPLRPARLDGRADRMVRRSVQSLEDRPLMRIGLNRSALRKLRPAELAWRFVLGGAITTAAGLIAELYGPAIGGLFLAFPAILPASLTLVAKHQEDRK